MSFSKSTSAPISTDNINSVVLSGANGIASSGGGNGLYYSSNSGQTWLQSNISTGNFSSVD